MINHRTKQASFHLTVAQSVASRAVLVIGHQGPTSFMPSGAFPIGTKAFDATTLSQHWNLPSKTLPHSPHLSPTTTTSNPPSDFANTVAHPHLSHRYPHKSQINHQTWPAVVKERREARQEEKAMRKSRRPNRTPPKPDFNSPAVA